MKFLPFAAYVGFVVCSACGAIPTPSPVDASTPASLATVKDIQDSCDNPDATQTIINGHAYLCMDYDSFVRQMQATQNALSRQGL
jgi:hypothetical protein